MSGQSDSGPPRRSMFGTLLMLPMRFILVLGLLFYLIFFRRGWFPGEFLVISVVGFLGLFVIRTLY